jgi:uncharacterized membrane protein YfcA
VLPAVPPALPRNDKLMAPTYIVIVILASLMIGLSKGGFGGPVPVAMLTPLLSLIMPAPQATGIVLPLLIFADIFALRSYWKTWDIKIVKLMLPMGVLGVVMGSILLGALKDQDMLFRRILGAFTLAVVIFKLINDHLNTVQYQHRDWHAYLAGWTSGFGSALANVGAPPFTAYMLLQGVTPLVFIGTTTLFFAIVNALKLPGVFITGVLTTNDILSILWALPIIPVGVWLGRKFVKWINPVIFERFMLVLLCIMGMFLLFYTPPGR